MLTEQEPDTTTVEANGCTTHIQFTLHTQYTAHTILYSFHTQYTNYTNFFYQPTTTMYNMAAYVPCHHCHVCQIFFHRLLSFGVIFSLHVFSTKYLGQATHNDVDSRGHNDLNSRWTNVAWTNILYSTTSIKSSRFKLQQATFW